MYCWLALLFPTFPFFFDSVTQFPPPSAAMFYSDLLLAVYIITFLLGFPSNILAFCTFCRKVHRKPTPIDILLLNLTISDLIFLIFLPFKMKEARDNMLWLMDFPLCPFTTFLFFVTIYNSTLLLTAVSVERYLGVAYPLRYSLWRRPRYAVLASISIWLVTSLNLSIVYIMPYLQWGSNNSNNSSSSGPRPPPHHCYRNFTEKELDIIKPFRLELFIFLFCIPFIISCFCYIRFILILSRLPNIGRRRRLRADGLALGTLIVFTMCFGPYNVSHVVGFVQLENEDWRNIALLSTTFNACLDPFIFYFSSVAVRTMLNSCFRSIVGKLHILRFGAAPPQKSTRSGKYRETVPP
ncbi:free fatty acid receptor 3-like [Cynoglossus semilaevis]|uniref:free fatty acid receptor 3-like n=1 Tax=Cynoglossus semilaevis TaxID=244447 RepID=UPI000D62ACDE|nr:free fatty acid receptor 3-like [Cynoglossus semilaevis]